MDNERDCLERIELKDVRDADDKQWYIECQVLETDRLNAEASILHAKASSAHAESDIIQAKARLQEAQNESAKLKAANRDMNTLKVSCSGCGADFEYTGPDAEQMTECYDKFSYQHSSCQ